jgi:hypothetical protein
LPVKTEKVNLKGAEKILSKDLKSWDMKIVKRWFL